MKRSIASILIVLLAFAVSASSQKRNITEKDLFDFVWVGDPQISPDGSRVVFVKVTVNAAKTNYDTSIWMVSTDGGEPRRITSGNRDSNPRWSPDGTYLTFQRAGETPGPASAPQLYMMSMAGGEAWAYTSLPRGAGGAAWSPDGKWIVFGSSANPEDLAKQGKPADPNVRESDVRVITRAVYRSDSGGYIDSTRPGHIWVIEAPKSPEQKVTPRQLTKGEFSEGGAVWSKDSSKIYFVTNRDPEPYYSLPKTEVYSVSVNGGDPELLTKFPMGVGLMSLSPDGKRFAFTTSSNGDPVKSYSQPDLWVMDIEKNARPKNLTTEFDFDVGGGLTGDQAAPRAGGGTGPIWTADGRGIIERFAKEGRTNLAIFDSSTGAVSNVTTGDHAIMSFKASSDSSRIAYVRSTPTIVGDLYVMDRGGSSKQLTKLNDALFSKLNLTEPDDVWYQSFDGKRVQTWVQKPANFDPKQKYPLILNIHGGPHAAYGYVFSHEFQWMAAKGYVVVYPNPRGSTSYGQDFGNIIQYKYPGDDHKDLMFAVDEVIKRGYIDTKKLGVTGGSGGGVLTNHAVTQTDRFAAAVSQRDISDWANWWYTADFAQFQPAWFQGAPFEDVEGFRERSAITHVAKIKTPMMFILGEADWRTPPAAGGEELFRALKYRKVPTVMVRFPNESHELSRSGQPWHRIERLQHIVGWFDKWLIGDKKPEYEISQ